jgi:hypothetical protein
MLVADNALPLRQALLVKRQRSVVFALVFKPAANAPPPRLLLPLPLQPLRHGAQHAAVQPREPAVQPPHSREDAPPVLLPRTLALFRAHLAQHVVERPRPLRDLLQNSSALGRREGGAAAAARVQLDEAPGAREADGAVPRRHDHDHLAHAADGGDERLLPPLGRLGEGGVLAGGEQIEPDDDEAAFAREERFKRLHHVQKHVAPRVADEPRRGLHARVAGALHLGAQGQLGGARLRRDEAVLDVVGGKAFESSLAAVCVDEVAEGGEQQAVGWKVVGGTRTGKAVIEFELGSTNYLQKSRMQ